MINKCLITVLMEHNQYAKLIFKVDGERVRLHDLEGRINSDAETITLNFMRCDDD